MNQPTPSRSSGLPLSDTKRRGLIDQVEGCETMDELVAVLRPWLQICDLAVQRHVMPYRQYLATDWWQLVRAGALNAAGGACQVCNATETLDVHHRTYERRGMERAEDLIVLCRDCHTIFHENGKLAT
jgi:hypothetical protein